jgi:hypothetical protein
MSGLGIAWAVLALARNLAAAAPIEWEAPDGCPSTQAVYDELQRALGHEPRELGQLSRVRGTIVPEPTGYRLTLEVSDSGRRSLRSIHAEHCEDLANAAALAIALAVHAGPGASDAGPAAEAAGVSLEPGAAAPPAEPAPLDRGDRRGGSAPGELSTVSWSAGAHALLDVGALPDPALGLSIVARARLASFELDVHGALLPTQSLPVGDGESIDLGLMAAGLRGCLRVLERSFVAAACFGGEAGRFTARGVGLTPQREASDVWLAVGPALLARTSFVGPLQLEFLAEPLLPLLEKRYAVNEIDVVHTPSVVDVRLQLGLIIIGGAGGDEAP